MTLLPETSTLFLPFRGASSTGAPPLRVGVVVDGVNPAPWVHELLAFLRQLPGIDSRLLALTNGSPAGSRPPPWLTGRLYSASRARFDPFGEIPADAAPPDSGALDTVRTARCHVLLWLAASKDPTVDLAELAKHGAFTVRLGKGDRMIPFWDEVANGDITSTVTIYWHESSLGHGRAIRAPETSTSLGLYLTMNAEEPLVATLRTLAGLCLELRDGGRQYEERLRGFSDEPMNASTRSDYPSSFEAGRFVMKKLARRAQMRSRNRGKEVGWFIAIRPNRGKSVTDTGRLDLTGFRELSLPQGSKQMADPFLLENDGHTYLLFEVEAAGSRGRLGCVEVFNDGSASEMKIILERNYHLSYPCVAQMNGELFLLPESADAGRVDLYRFTRFPWEVDLASTLVEGVALVDTTPFFHEGRWYFFTTTPQPFMETLLFWADRLDGAWNLHPSAPISVSVRNGRSAGNLFWKDGRLYRPTQDCSVRYGHAMQVNEITRLTPVEFKECPVASISPTWMPRLVGTHTWNESAKFQVIDGLRFQPITI